MRERFEQPRDSGNGRQHPRVDLFVEVTLESESNFYAGISNNLSEGGVFVATFAPPRIGAPVALVLGLPGSGQRFALSGVVRWVREAEVCQGVTPGCGIEWLELPDGARTAIERFVRSRDTELYELR
jgi:uncharacterized protein (TIGR02266 family)